MVVEVDLRAWYLSPQDWENTPGLLRADERAGVCVMRFTPRQVHTKRPGLAATMRSALAATRRPLPLIRALPAE